MDGWIPVSSNFAGWHGARGGWPAPHLTAFAFLVLIIACCSTAFKVNVGDGRIRCKHCLVSWCRAKHVIDLPRRFTRWCYTALSLVFLEFPTFRCTRYELQELLGDSVYSFAHSFIHVAFSFLAQLEIAEVLVSHGASFNAKTYQDEMPVDLCEDEDMRQRLIDLKMKRDAIMRTQGHTRSSLQRKTSSIGSRGKVSRRVSVNERSDLYRREHREEATLWMKLESAGVDDQVASGTDEDGTGSQAGRSPQQNGELAETAGKYGKLLHQPASSPPLTSSSTAVAVAAAAAAVAAAAATGTACVPRLLSDSNAIAGEPMALHRTPSYVDTLRRRAGNSGLAHHSTSSLHHHHHHQQQREQESSASDDHLKKLSSPEDVNLSVDSLTAPKSRTPLAVGGSGDASAAPAIMSRARSRQTLAELKRQRAAAMLRGRALSLEGLALSLLPSGPDRTSTVNGGLPIVPEETPAAGSGGGEPGEAALRPVALYTSLTTLPLQDPPLVKFRSMNSLDIVGEARNTRCCIVM